MNATEESCGEITEVEVVSVPNRAYRSFKDTLTAVVKHVVWQIDVTLIEVQYLRLQ